VCGERTTEIAIALIEKMLKFAFWTLTLISCIQISFSFSISPVFSRITLPELVQDEQVPSSIQKSIQSSLFGSRGLSRPALNSEEVDAKDLGEVVDAEPIEWKKVGPAVSLGGLKLNLYGAWYMLFSCFILAPIWLAGLYVVKLLHMMFKDWDPTLVQYDNVSKWWARNTLRIGQSWPTVEGMEKIPPQTEAVMFVANHTSWFDIVCISLAMMSRPFKFVSKTELLKVPVMGTSLNFGGHVLISRESRKSQMQTFKQGVQWLKKGVSLITYAEGTRSKDGRIKRFKRGAVKMAMQAKVKVVPVSLVGMHRAFPAWAVMPICPGGKFMKVIVHEPIETVGQKEEDIMKATFEAIKSGLPTDQQ